MKTVRITWIDSTTVGVLGTKIFRDDIEIGDVGNGVEVFDDVNAVGGIDYKYEVQGYTSTGESTAEVLNVNVTEVDVTISNYVFDQSADAFFLADDISILNGIIAQTWIVWGTITGDNSINKGLLGSTKSTALRMLCDTTNLIDCQLNDTGQTAVTNCTWTQDETPQQFAFTFDGTTMWFYNQGLPIKSSIGDFTARNNGREVVFGQAGLTNLNGTEKEIQFYNRALTDSEMLALFNDPTDLPADNATSLEAKWADNKTTQVWTDDIKGYTMQNQGGVTTS